MDHDVFGILRLEMGKIERPYGLDGLGQSDVDVCPTGGAAKLATKTTQRAQSSRSIESLSLAVIAEAHAFNLPTVGLHVNSPRCCADRPTGWALYTTLQVASANHSDTPGYLQACARVSDIRIVSTWSYLRRMFGSAAQSTESASRTAVLERLEPPAATGSGRSVEKAGSRETHGPVDTGTLEDEVHRAIDTLRTEVSQEQQTPDFVALLDALAGNLSGQLRQLPSAAQHALAACGDPDVPVPALVPLFERDPILAKALLERANSVYYNPAGAPCVSLLPAIVRQGRRSAHNVILEQVMGGMVCRPGRAWEGTVNRIWSHMVRTGPIARAVAPAFGVDVEQAFALGLLHDVGKLVVFDTLAAQRNARHSDLLIPHPALKRTLRLLHEPLGGLCALKWELGEEAARAISTHHREPLPDPPDPLAEVIWLAERIDLVTQKALPIDLGVLWVQGSLQGDRADAEARLLDRP
jgi:HD-like signal output (HDOD) protein